ncbi:MAG TPA: hypothetical protein VI454_16730, partial [Verrucomicrobiae bacterium]
MTAARFIPERWTARKWALVIGGLSLVQFGLIAGLSQRSFPLPRAETAATMVKLINGGVPSGPYETTLASDPTLFALLNRRGFSGDAWLEFPAYEHLLSDWQEPPKWLAPQRVPLGTEF